MASSSSSNYALDAEQICTAALEMLGLVAIGDTPGATELAKALEQLNLLVKTWGADPAPKLWLLTEGTQALSASTASYTLTAARKVLSVRRRTSNIDTPLQMWSRQDYFDFPSKTQAGMPFAWYFDPQQSGRKLYVVNVPDATIAASTTLQYTYLRVIEDLDNFSDDFDVPQEWLEVLQYGLAARLSLAYRTHIADAAGAAEIKQRAAELYGQLSSYDEEAASVFVGPSFQP